MDAEGLGRKLLLTLPSDLWRALKSRQWVLWQLFTKCSPCKDFRVLSIPARQRRGGMGRGEAFGCPSSSLSPKTAASICTIIVISFARVKSQGSSPERARCLLGIRRRIQQSSCDWPLLRVFHLPMAQHLCYDLRAKGRWLLFSLMSRGGSVLHNLTAYPQNFCGNPEAVTHLALRTFMSPTDLSAVSISLWVIPCGEGYDRCCLSAALDAGWICDLKPFEWEALKEGLSSSPGLHKLQLMFLSWAVLHLSTVVCQDSQSSH